jgi:L-threonylcarbamoyladenylate synthase
VSTADDAVKAIRAGELVVIPTDTVYGLACTPYDEEPVRALSELKGRTPGHAIALVAASLDWLFESVPELRGQAGMVARALLPGPYTLVVPNPERRYPWLAGDRPEAIGVRVPHVAGELQEILDRVGVLAATSANLHRGEDPRRLGDVPPELRVAVAVAVDGGELPGTPSTVLDLTGPDPRVLREGAVPGPEAIAQVEAALDG